MHGASKPLIVSHGGRHGTGATYLQGQPLPEAVVPFLGREHLGAVTRPVETPIPAATVPSPAPEPPAATDAPAVPQTSNTAQPPLPPVPPTPPGPPKTRAQLYLLNKEQVIVLAGQLGLKASPEETVKVIKDRIQEHLGL